MTILHHEQQRKSLWQQGIQRALEEGVISAAPHSVSEPVSLSTFILTFIGALVSANLFLAALVLFFVLIEIDSVSVCYVFSAIFVLASLSFLRLKPKASLFLELLMFILLIAGLVLLSAALFIESRGNTEWIFLLMAFVILGCAFIVPAHWMRASGSFVSAVFLYFFLLEASDYSSLGRFAFVWLHPLLSVVLLFVGQYYERCANWKLLNFLEPLIQGWVTVTLLLLAYTSGKTMFMAQFAPFEGGGLWGDMDGLSQWEYLKHPLIWLQILCLPLAFLWARTQNSLFKETKILLLAIIFTLFALIEPLLSLCLALTLLVYVTGRHRLAILGGMCALWIVGSVYYLMRVSLLEKSIWFAVTGCVLIGIALLGQKPKSEKRDQTSQKSLKEVISFSNRRTVNMVLIAVAALVAFGGVNASIWKQEQLRKEGVQVFIKLAPVDPRSLMQGDYMALNFSVPWGIANSDKGEAYLAIDEQGVGHFVANAQHDAIPFQLERRSGRWVVAADAWFFKEGDAKRWEAARYGVFKVDALGRSSLVGMADDDLQIIEFYDSAENMGRQE